MHNTDVMSYSIYKIAYYYKELETNYRPTVMLYVWVVAFTDRRCRIDFSCVLTVELSLYWQVFAGVESRII